MEPCPCCFSASLTIETPAGESRARVSCWCGAKGPMAGNNDARPWQEAAIAEWNSWVRGRRSEGR